MPHKDDDAPACQGEGCHEDDFAAHSVPQDRPPVARWGLIWAVTPVGVLHLDTRRVYLPFLRVVVPGWLALGDVWDAIPRAFQRPQPSF